MSACEECWTEASRRALMLGGHTVDHYQDLLAEHARVMPTVPHRTTPTKAKEAQQ